MLATQCLHIHSSALRVCLFHHHSHKTEAKLGWLSTCPCKCGGQRNACPCIQHQFHFDMSTHMKPHSYTVTGGCFPAGPRGLLQGAHLCAGARTPPHLLLQQPHEQCARQLRRVALTGQPALRARGGGWPGDSQPASLTATAYRRAPGHQNAAPPAASAISAARGHPGMCHSQCFASFPQQQQQQQWGTAAAAGSGGALAAAV